MINKEKVIALLVPKCPWQREFHKGNTVLNISKIYIPLNHYESLISQIVLREGGRMGVGGGEGRREGVVCLKSANLPKVSK